ncbi:MAG: DUF6602 domain-containing protein [Streptosporangiaceae bacterium]
MPDVERRGMQGWREFLAEKHDLLRSFTSASEKATSRPIKGIEPGRVAESVFRKWLAGFLPARYGVTAGYIISPGLTDETPIMHFDVIIYDRLESPVLWHEDNPDLSEQGRSRPIPVEHVLAVLEIKSTLTRAEASKAIAKLHQLDPLLAQVDDPDDFYPKHLRPNFACGVVFFKVDPREKNTTLAPLIAPDIRGYFGGVILSSATDSNCDEAGQLHLVRCEDRMPDTHENILDSVIIFPPSAQVAEQHFSIVMMWNPNSFVYFAHELLARLRGTFRVGVAPTAHGMSFVTGSDTLPRVDV